MGKTTISWTDKVWNPVRGCSMAKGSEDGGCLNCYAARMAARNLAELKSPTTGESFARILSSGPRWTGKVELIESALRKPLRWRKPAKVFVNSMSDLFHESITNEQIARVFRVICKSRGRHTYQILTKRAERLVDWFSWAILNEPGWFNSSGILDLWGVWIGVSCENQATADARIPLLLQTPAAMRFVSYEPALEAIDFTQINLGASCWVNSLTGESYSYNPIGGVMKNGRVAWNHLDWVIVGGESGPGARPFNIEWARNTIRQHAAAGVSCFVKQLGPQPYDSKANQQPMNYWPGEPYAPKCRYGAVKAFTGSEKEFAMSHILKDRKGGDMDEWPEDLRIRQFPGDFLNGQK